MIVSTKLQIIVELPPANLSTFLGTLAGFENRWLPKVHGNY